MCTERAGNPVREGDSSETNYDEQETDMPRFVTGRNMSKTKKTGGTRGGGKVRKRVKIDDKLAKTEPSSL